MHNPIFITYNPGAQLEQSLAVRLYTIGMTHHFQMYLPDRTWGDWLNEETQYRITRSDWFVCFTTRAVSNTVLQEIRHAFEVKQDRSRIILVRDRRAGRTLGNTELYTEFAFDPTPEGINEILAAIFRHIMQVEGRVRAASAEKAESINTAKALGVLLGVGLGMIALDALVGSNEEEQPAPRKTPAAKRSAKPSSKTATKSGESVAKEGAAKSGSKKSAVKYPRGTASKRVKEPAKSPRKRSGGKK